MIPAMTKTAKTEASTPAVDAVVDLESERKSLQAMRESLDIEREHLEAERRRDLDDAEQRREARFLAKLQEAAVKVIDLQELARERRDVAELARTKLVVGAIDGLARSFDRIAAALGSKDQSRG